MVERKPSSDIGDVDLVELYTTGLMSRPADFSDMPDEMFDFSDDGEDDADANLLQALEDEDNVEMFFEKSRDLALEKETPRAMIMANRAFDGLIEYLRPLGLKELIESEYAHSLPDSLFSESFKLLTDYSRKKKRALKAAEVVVFCEKGQIDSLKEEFSDIPFLVFKVGGPKMIISGRMLRLTGESLRDTILTTLATYTATTSD